MKIAKMAAREHREIHDVEQTNEEDDSIRHEKNLLGWHVCKLVFGVDTYLI